MSFVTLDFETFYDQKCSLKRLTTEEYIRDPRFEVIGVGMKIDDEETQWFSGTHAEIKAWLNQVDWMNSALLCHNTQFDGAILAWIFDIIPAYYFDTLCMARAKHGVDAGGSLKALAEQYKLGVKGDEVINAMGKNRLDFSPSDLDRYASYCRNDVDLTFSLFAKLAQGFPRSELDLIDMTLRMYTEPVLRVDDALLVQRLEEIKQEKSTLLRGLMDFLGVGQEEEVRKKLASNPQFAAILKDHGVEPPMKTSPTTGKETYALAKNDEGFIDLLENGEPIIQQLCAVRLGTKSTIEESRIERFIDIGARNKGLLPIPLKYYGAHTGRWSGADSVNFQNLPSRDKAKAALKKSVLAPEGHIVINCDSSQIEARVLAWLAGQDEVTEQFANGEDVYSIFATKIYKKPISKANPVERFVGKTCIAEGTLVLCRQGWKPIETVTTNDQLWDGEEWVCHQGLLYNGIKPTLNLCGIWLTPDHQVWSGIWHRADYLQQDADTLSRALGIAAENLPLQATWLVQEESKLSSFVATATQQNTKLTATISKTSSRPAAISALKNLQVQSDTGNILKQWLTINTGLAYSTGYQPQLHDATHQLIAPISTTGSVVYESLTNGGEIKQRFSDMFKLWKDGITQLLRWTGSTWTGITNRATSGSYHVAKTYITNEKSLTLKPVYDILNSGSRNRFTILTERGPLIAHNCILGLGYGTGAAKLRHTLKTQPPGADLTEEECKRIVDLYRSTNHKIPSLWNECEGALSHLAAWPETTPIYSLGAHGAVWATPKGILLPNGLYIYYPKLSIKNRKYSYVSRKGVVSLWGGAVVENIVQALARIIVGEQMLELRKAGYRPVLTVHDAAVCVVEQTKADEAVREIINIMSTPPAWAKGLPVACEAHSGVSYGDCK